MALDLCKDGSSEMILHVLHTLQTWIVSSPFKSARHMINQTTTHQQIHHAMRLAKSRRPSLFELLISTREISQIVQADVHPIPNSWTLVLVWFVI
jgi:hypothetical protein